MPQQGQTGMGGMGGMGGMPQQGGMSMSGHDISSLRNCSFLDDFFVPTLSGQGQMGMQQGGMGGMPQQGQTGMGGMAMGMHSVYRAKIFSS